ncbi:hypothetical protein IHE44_0001868, partial [Lamprotornis superbus]
MAGPGSDGDLRRLLKLHRTEIAMAVDDVFPLLHGLADHDVVPDHIFKETLSRTEREGSHRAFHALLTWLLGRDTAALRDFWAVLFKDYNLERYSRLRPLRGAFPREVELGRQRRGRRLSPSPTAPAPHRPQGKRKAPEERDKARAAQPGPRHSTSPGMETQSRMETGKGAAPEAVAASVQRAVAVAGGEVPVSRGAIEGILIKHVLDPSSSKTGSRGGDVPYTPAACEEPEAKSRSYSLKPPAQPKACQTVQTSPSYVFTPIFCSCQGCEGGVVPPWHHSHGLGGVPQCKQCLSKLLVSPTEQGTPIGHPGPAASSHCPMRVAVTPCPLSRGQENEDECAACGDGGELICCDGCPRAFHLACLVPPLPHVPSGTWRCGSCVENVTEPGKLLERPPLPVERPPGILGEEVRDTQAGGVEGSVCSRCCTRIPTARHCPAPSADP